MQDATGGIALYLDDPAVAAWPAGTQVQASGVVASRYGQRTVRLAEGDLLRGESTELPVPPAHRPARPMKRSKDCGSPSPERPSVPPQRSRTALG